MSTISTVRSKSSIQFSEQSIRDFLKPLAFYALSFIFWVGLFISNEGPGGVEYQHLVLQGIVHAVLIFIHGLSVFNSEQTNEQYTPTD